MCFLCLGEGGVDVGRTLWRRADNLEKTLLCNFYFCGQLKKKNLVSMCNDGHARVKQCGDF